MACVNARQCHYQKGQTSSPPDFTSSNFTKHDISTFNQKQNVKVKYHCRFAQDWVWWCGRLQTDVDVLPLTAPCWRTLFSCTTTHFSHRGLVRQRCGYHTIWESTHTQTQALASITLSELVVFCSRILEAKEQNAGTIIWYWGNHQFYNKTKKRLVCLSSLLALSLPMT